MAAVTTLKNGTRRIDFMGLDGVRRYVRLGEISAKSAALFSTRIEQILGKAALGEPLDPATSTWLAELPATTHEKLANVGLVPSRGRRNSNATRLGTFADAYLEKRNDLKPASVLVVSQVIENLKRYFGEDRQMGDITPAEADDFRRWMGTSGRKRGRGDAAESGLSPATVGKRLQWCATIFRDAVRRKLISENPFDGLKLPKGSNPDRQVYVPAVTIEKLIELVPEAEWKLALALSRYLGLRCPSEHFSLTWDCVDWEQGRLRVPSPKTEHHGKSFRIVPILPQVRPHLDQVFADAPEGSVYVLHRIRQRESTKATEKGFWANANLRQRLMKLIVKAGLKPWPRLFHALRSSAQTDLASYLPLHVVCEWLGNTKAIAQEHYLQVTDEHFRLATGQGGPAQQNAQHDSPKPAEITANLTPENAETPVKQGFLEAKVEAAGIEPAFPSPSQRWKTENAWYRIGSRLRISPLTLRCCRIKLLSASNSVPAYLTMSYDLPPVKDRR